MRPPKSNAIDPGAAPGADDDAARLQLFDAVAGVLGDAAEIAPPLLLVIEDLHWADRSTRDLLNTLAAIADRKVGFRSLGDTWADTTTSHGRLMLTVLGGLAEFERDLIRTRTGEGRAPWPVV